MLPSTRQRALADASMEATRLHRRLHTDWNKPVDVFGIAQQLGLWVMSQPLDNLYGFYLRSEAAAGIVINNKHPESLQRFTAAHEIGHHVLGHAHSADDSDNMGQFSGSSLDELQAQAFATSLLMPTPRVNRVLKEIAPAGYLSPSEVYLFSRQMGVSFTAAVWTLVQRKRVAPQSAAQMAKTGAAAAKTELRGRSWIADARADVWVLTGDQAGVTVLCRAGDEIHVQLEENLSTGGVWTIESPEGLQSLYEGPHEDDQVDVWGDEEDQDPPVEDLRTSRIAAAAEAALTLELDAHVAVDGRTYGDAGHELDEDLFGAGSEMATSDPYEANDPSWEILPGVGGVRSLVFVARRIGSSEIRLSRRPMWSPSARPSADYQVGVRVRGPSRIAGQGVVQPLKDEWAEMSVATS